MPVEQVVTGNGADELIRLCGAAALDAGDAAVVPWPSFPSYLSAAAVHGADVVKVPPVDGYRDRSRGGARGAAAGSSSWPTRTTPPAPC